jgi:hypothetical protein
MFSKNFDKDKRAQFMSALNLSQQEHSDKYLGLPVYVGRSRSKMFEYLKDKVWKRIQGWKQKLLSRVVNRL